ncbi:MAG: hypothetical protein A3J75_05530 [Acidobacteria bacterium RBG_16_68_9]|nr:MAG: hypothetical protein A3J75_05530 [Acidobacteria bacterium RBG_16_68_9]
MFRLKTEPWGVEFFRRYPADDAKTQVPGREFLDAIPHKVAARMVAVLEAVAEAPPPSYSGGGYWEAMHNMAGFYEVRVDSQRTHYRLFCLLERDGKKVGLEGPSVVVITGKKKRFRTLLSPSDYAEVRALGEEFRRRSPRKVQR